MAKKTDSEPSYWAVTKEPRYALALVLPMLVIYQLGLLALARLDRGAPEVRNVADLYVQWVMDRFGLGGHLASGALVIAVLVGWQILAGRGWRLRLGHVVGMVLESVFYALVLLLSYRVVIVPLKQALLAAGPGSANLAQQLVLGLGAGVYEEFLFRLLLIGCVGYLFRLAGAGRVSSAVVASIVAAVAFSTFHLVSEPFEPFTFIFRTFAGLVFAGFFFLRGFGITTGTHASFNVIRSLLVLFGLS